MTRGFARLLLACVLIAPLAAQSGSSTYRTTGTLPNTFDGRLVISPTFDATTHRLYGLTEFGLYYVDFSGESPSEWRPLVKQDIGKDLGALNIGPDGIARPMGSRGRGVVAVSTAVQRIAVAPDLDRVFYAASDGIYAYDVRAGGTTKLSPKQASNLAYVPATHELYASLQLSADLLVFDGRTSKAPIANGLPGWNAFELRATPAHVFCFVGGKDGIYAVDTATHHVTRFPVIGSIVTPGMLQTDPGGAYLFLASNREIDAIDLATGKVTGRVTVFGPAALAFDPGTGLLITSHPVRTAPGFAIAALRPEAGGLTETAALSNPPVGVNGVWPTDDGFIQAGDRAFVIWQLVSAGEK